jgi:hypothetical protein
VRGHSASAAELRSVEAERGQFKVTLSDDRVLRSPDLVGAVLTIAQGGGAMRVRIGLFEAAEPGIFELTCASGAQGKCVRYDYFSWEGAAGLAATTPASA